MPQKEKAAKRRAAPEAAGFADFIMWAGEDDNFVCSKISQRESVVYFISSLSLSLLPGKWAEGGGGGKRDGGRHTGAKKPSYNNVWS
jgi:hypothetical protein